MPKTTILSPDAAVAVERLVLLVGDARDGGATGLPQNTIDGVPVCGLLCLAVD